MGAHQYRGMVTIDKMREPTKITGIRNNCMKTIIIMFMTWFISLISRVDSEPEENFSTFPSEKL